MHYCLSLSLLSPGRSNADGIALAPRSVAAQRQLRAWRAWLNQFYTLTLLVRFSATWCPFSCMCQRFLFGMGSQATADSIAAQLKHPAYFSVAYFSVSYNEVLRSFQETATE